MKLRLTFILACLACCLYLKGQQNRGVAANDTANTTVIPVQNLPPAPVFPVDTQAVLKMLDFESINYDSLFSIQSPAHVIQQPSTKHVTARDFVLPVLLLVMLAYVTWLRYLFAKELGENITVLLNSNLGQQIYRDREFSANIFKLLTFVNFAFSAGVFLFLLARFHAVTMPFDNAAYNIAVTVAGVAALYLVKGLIYRIAGVTFKLSNALQFYRFNSLVIYHLIGIGMLPLVILGAFAEAPVNEWALKVTLGLISLALIIRLVKGFAALRLVGRFHLMYFLLYICALEIAPILIAIKVFTMWD